MANQPSPMVPQSPEVNPDRFDAPPSEEIRLTRPDQKSQTPVHEQRDAVQADTVREKLVTEAAGLAASTQTLQPGLTASQAAKTIGSQLASMKPEDQINHLVGLAHSQGLDHAFKIANATNNAYVIDRFHDELVNRVLHNKQQSM